MQGSFVGAPAHGSSSRSTHLHPWPVQVYVVPLPPSAVDEGDGISDLSDEDLEFVASQGKNLGFLTSLKTKQLDRCGLDWQNGKAWCLSQPLGHTALHVIVLQRCVYETLRCRLPARNIL